MAFPISEVLRGAYYFWWGPKVNKGHQVQMVNAIYLNLKFALTWVDCIDDMQQISELPKSMPTAAIKKFSLSDIVQKPPGGNSHYSSLYENFNIDGSVSTT